MVQVSNTSSLMWLMNVSIIGLLQFLPIPLRLQLRPDPDWDELLMQL